MLAIVVTVCSVAQLRLTLRPHGLQPNRVLCPWDFPGKNTGVGCHFLFQGIFRTQESDQCLLCWLADSFFFNLLKCFFIFLKFSIDVVLPYIDMNPPYVYMCSPSWTPHPPPSPSHSSGSPQCTSPKHPVSCIKPGLPIRFTYDNIHVSIYIYMANSLPLSHLGTIINIL